MTEITKTPEETDKLELSRLATLSPLQYDRERDEASKKLGCRGTTLDAAVEALRKTSVAKPTRAERRYSNPPTGRRTNSDPTLAQLAASKKANETANQKGAR